jgi:hypothetical protein
MWHGVVIPELIGTADPRASYDFHSLFLRRLACSGNAFLYSCGEAVLQTLSDNG